MADAVARFIITATDETGAAFSSAEEHLAGLAVKLVAFAAAFAAVDHVAEGVVEAFERIKHTAETASIIGTTPEALTAIEVAAARAGASTESMDGAVEKMVRSIGQAQAGMGAALPWFQRWNIDIKEFAHLDAAQQFARISAEIDKLPSKAAQAAAITSIFGRSGMEIARVVQEGGESLNKATEDANAWGLALNAVDTAKVSQAGVAMTEARQAADGLYNRIALALSPYVTKLADDFLGLATRTQGFKEQVGGIDSALETAAVWIGNVGHALTVVWNLMNAVFAALAAGIMEVINYLSTSIMYPFVKIEELINKVTASINQIAGTHIQPIKFFEDGQENRAELMSSYVDRMHQTWDTFKQSLNAPMPEEAIHKWFADARSEADKSAKAIAAKMGPALSGGDDLGDTNALKKKLQQEVDQVQHSTDDQVQRVQAGYAKEQKTLDDALAHHVISQQKYQQLSEQAYHKYQLDLIKAAQSGELQRETFSKMSWQLQVANVASSLEQMTAGVANSNRTMFELNKVAGIANAVVNTAVGVSKALAAYPPPLSFVMAAAQLVAGLAQVEAIRNADFGGGTTPSLAGSTPTVNNVPLGVTETIVPGGPAGTGGPTTDASVNVAITQHVDARGTSAEAALALPNAMKQATDQAVQQVQVLARQGRLGR